VRLLDSVPDAAIAALLGIEEQSGIEAELPECLLAVYPGDTDFPLSQWRHYRLPPLPPLAWAGVPEPLSSSHHDWPIIDVVAEATERRSLPLPSHWRPAPPREGSGPRRPVGLRLLARQRRSAVAMDGRTSMRREDFLRTMHRVLPGALPFDAFPWRPAIHLFVFLHRVEGVEPGLYALVRDADASIRTAVDPRFAWEAVDPSLPLYRLRSGDVRAEAQGVSCGQDIAGDGAFALGMVADLGAGLDASGAPFYRRLHWEAGAVGQVLYLEAESDGLRATGIGCFFDDSMHDALGIPHTSSWKTLYHFTVGGPVEDERLRTLAPYAHLD
jgi:hypothetical protein